MRLHFDHLVHFIDRNPAEVVSCLGEEGFHAVMGGHHEMWGTYNALCYFDLAYVEFLAVEDRSVAESARDNGLISQLLWDLQKGEGLGQIAIRTDDILGLANQLREKGFEIDLREGSRKRNDGSLLRWKMLFIANDAERLPYPFFIEWDQDDESRRVELTARKVIANHPLGNLKLKAIYYLVNHLASAIEKWSLMLGCAASDPYVDDELGSTCQSFKIGEVEIIFCQPSQENHIGPMLINRGERPFMIKLTGASKAKKINLYNGIYLLEP